MNSRIAVFVSLAGVAHVAPAWAESAPACGMYVASPSAAVVPANLPGLRLFASGGFGPGPTSVRVMRVTGSTAVVVPSEVMYEAGGSVAVRFAEPLTAGASYRLEYTSCYPRWHEFQAGPAVDLLVDPLGTLTLETPVLESVGGGTVYRTPTRFVPAAALAGLAGIAGVTLAVGARTIGTDVLTSDARWSVYAQCHGARGELATDGTTPLLVTLRWPTGELIGDMSAALLPDCGSVPPPPRDSGMIDGSIDASETGSGADVPSVPARDVGMDAPAVDVAEMDAALSDAPAVAEAGADGAARSDATAVAEAGGDGGRGEDVPPDMMARGGCSATPRGGRGPGGALMGLIAVGIAGASARRVKRRRG